MRLRAYVSATVAVALSALLVVVYPDQGLLLAVAFGATLAGMLDAGTRAIGARRIAAALCAAASVGTALLWAGAPVRMSLEFVLLGVLCIAVFGLHRMVAAAPARPTDRSANRGCTRSHA